MLIRKSEDGYIGNNVPRERAEAMCGDVGSFYSYASSYFQKFRGNLIYSIRRSRILLPLFLFEWNRMEAFTRGYQSLTSLEGNSTHENRLFRKDGN